MSYRPSRVLAVSTVILDARQTALSLALSLAFISLALSSAPAHAYDLQQAYADAAAIDPIVASARFALKATQEKVPQARSLDLPQVNTGATINRQVSDPSNIPTRKFTSQGYNVTLNYPLYRAQNIETLEQGKLAVAISEAQLASAQQDLIVRVSQAYFDVLTAQDNVAVIRSQKKAISEQQQSAKRNFEVGTATITDQQEADSRFDLVVFQEIAALNDLEVKRTTLATLIGKSVPQIDTLKRSVALLGPQPANWEDWRGGARKDNYTVQQATIAVENAKREMKKQQLATRPTVDLVGSVSHSENSLVSSIGIRANSAALGVQFAMPLYTGGAIESRVREAAANINKSEFDLSNAQNQAELGARQSYLSLNSLVNQVRALEAAEKSSRLSLDSNLLGYQVGVRINIDVLNAQQQLFSTQRDLAKARYDLLVNSLRLKAATGSLRPDDITGVNALLETPPVVTIPSPTVPVANPNSGTPVASPKSPEKSGSTNSAEREQPGSKAPMPVAPSSRGGRSTKPFIPAK